MRLFPARRGKPAGVLAMRNMICGHVHGWYTDWDQAMNHGGPILAEARRAGRPLEIADMPAAEARDGLLADRCADCVPDGHAAEVHAEILVPGAGLAVAAMRGSHG